MASDKDRELLARDRQAAVAYGEFAQRYTAAVLAGEREAAIEISRNAAAAVNGLSDALTEHAHYVKSRAEGVAQEAYATHASAVRWVIGANIVLGLLVALIGFFIYRHVSGGLDRMVGMFSATERNLDFTGRLQIVGNDELSQVGQAFNNLLERLQGSLRQILNTRSRLATLPAASRRHHVRCRWLRNTRAKRRRAWRRQLRK